MRSRLLAETPSRPALSAFDNPHAFASARNALIATSDSRSRSASLAKVCGSIGVSAGDAVLRLAMRAMSHLLVSIYASFGGKSSAFAHAIHVEDGPALSSPAKRGRGTMRSMVEGKGTTTDDESAATDHGRGPKTSPQSLGAGSDAVEPAPRPRARTPTFSAATSDWTLCARLLLRQGAARRRD